MQCGLRPRIGCTHAFSLETKIYINLPSFPLHDIYLFAELTAKCLYAPTSVLGVKFVASSYAVFVETKECEPHNLITNVSILQTQWNTKNMLLNILMFKSSF